MTTFSEVKRWTRPLLDADARLVLVGRNLLLRPVGHFIRGVYVDRTSNRLQSRLMLYIQPLFSPSSPGVGFPWSREQLPHRTDDEKFAAGFLDLCRRGLAELDQVESIDDFLKQAETVTSRSFGSVSIARYPLRHAEVLAALGRFAEALSILAPAMRDEETKWTGILARGKLGLEKKPNSWPAKSDVQHATTHLQAVVALKPLLGALVANDPAGVAELLMGHERHNAKLWKVDHLWEPTPFSFEVR